MILYRLYKVDDEYGYDIYVGLFKSIMTMKNFLIQDHEKIFSEDRGSKLIEPGVVVKILNDKYISVSYKFEFWIDKRIIEDEYPYFYEVIDTDKLE